MIVESLLKRGDIHTVYGEDSLFQTSIENFWVGAVMDGCSSAVESCFAATLFSKLVAKGCKLLPYLNKIQPDLNLQTMSAKLVGEFILNQVFSDIKKLQKQLLLENSEILSTLTLAVINSDSKSAYINFSGDGYYTINDQLFEIDQNNTPDFLGYHTNKSFEEWLTNHTYACELKNINSLTIATDGIAKLFKPNGTKHTDLIPQEYLTIQNIQSGKSTSIDHRYNSLTNEHELIPFDDIAILHFSLDQ